MRAASFALAMAVAVGSGCARRTDQRTRDAFNAARGGGQAGDGEKVVKSSGGGGGTFDRDKIGWERVAELVEEAVGIMRSSPNDDRFAELAARWCKIEPEPRNTVDGVVRVCNPEPPVVANGAPFSLEMGGEGVIGLVASDLTRADSERIALDAREAAGRFCVEPFESSSPTFERVNAPDDEEASPTRRSPRGRGASSAGPSRPPPRTLEEFHVCAVAGGPLLAITRFPRTPGSPRWMVAVTVLSPG